MKYMRNRIAWFFVVIMCIVAVIINKLVYLQYINAESLAEKAKEQRVITRVIPAKRGRILDSGGEVLAISSESYKILAKLDNLDASESKESLKLVSEVVPFDVEKALASMIEAGVGNYVTIRDGISKSEIELVNTVLNNKGIQNIVTDKVNLRAYPFHTLNSHVVGLTNMEGTGYLGIEQYYNSILAGSDGFERRTVDAERNPLPYGVHDVVLPDDGEDVYLTIKNSIQFFVEQAVREFHDEIGAKS
ncbi:MAG: hypothetical protein Q4A41_04050, partial [Bacillota bacterium]|nr:hypothetical protein [Bacillota bacterium]